MQTENLIGADKVMDVRAIPCSIKHGLIVRTYQDLPAGDYFILCNDHDPARMHNQFSAQWPGTFAWEYLVRTEDEFRIKITTLKPLTEPATPVATTCEGHGK